METELCIFVGGRDSQELMEMEKLSQCQGFITPEAESIIAALKNKPANVVIRGGMTQFCVANTATLALHFGVPEVIIDLRYCRATAWDRENDNNLERRRETLIKGLGRRTAGDPRLIILPLEH